LKKENFLEQNILKIRKKIGNIYPMPRDICRFTVLLGIRENKIYLLQKSSILHVLQAERPYSLLKSILLHSRST
jgi:hypothetical protein